MAEAVLVVDVQVDYCLPEGQLGQMGRDCAPTVKLISELDPFLDKARSIGIPVVVIRSETDTLCRPGTRGAELCIRVDPSDHLITKTTYGAFANGELGQTLRLLNVDRLVVAGVDTHVCVESTVREAKDLGYKVDVVRDLVATRGENADMHQASLTVMQKYFATMNSQRELLARWSSYSVGYPGSA